MPPRWRPLPLVAKKCFLPRREGGFDEVRLSAVESCRLSNSVFPLGKRGQSRGNNINSSLDVAAFSGVMHWNTRSAQMCSSLRSCFLKVSNVLINVMGDHVFDVSGRVTTTTKYYY